VSCIVHSSCSHAKARIDHTHAHDNTRTRVHACKSRKLVSLVLSRACVYEYLYYPPTADVKMELACANNCACEIRTRMHLSTRKERRFVCLPFVCEGARCDCDLCSYLPLACVGKRASHS